VEGNHTSLCPLPTSKSPPSSPSSQTETIIKIINDEILLLKHLVSTGDVHHQCAQHSTAQHNKHTLFYDKNGKCCSEKHLKKQKTKQTRKTCFLSLSLSFTNKHKTQKTKQNKQRKYRLYFEDKGVSVAGFSHIY